jgi:hypothetical protein
VLPPLVSWLLPHPLDRILAVPMGLALVWLGYTLWSEQGMATDQHVTQAVRSQPV